MRGILRNIGIAAHSFAPFLSPVVAASHVPVCKAFHKKRHQNIALGDRAPESYFRGVSPPHGDQALCAKRRDITGFRVPSTREALETAHCLVVDQSKQGLPQHLFLPPDLLTRPVTLPARRLFSRGCPSVIVVSFRKLGRCVACCVPHGRSGAQAGRDSF
jgi:hypothetical protein